MVCYSPYTVLILSHCGGKPMTKSCMITASREEVSFFAVFSLEHGIVKQNCFIVSSSTCVLLLNMVQ